MPKKMVSIREILALNLKEYRKKGGFTQESLAEKAGISANYLSMVEISKKFPTPDMLDRLAYALDIQTFQLFDPSSNPEGAVLHLEQSILSEINQTISNNIKQSFDEHRQSITETIEQSINKAFKNKNLMVLGTFFATHLFPLCLSKLNMV